MNAESLRIAIELIKQKEGCHLKAYLDIVGIPTIGWGETKGVKMGDVWTQEQADTRLAERVIEFMAGVIKACPQLHLEPPNRVAACTSLAYNIGLAGWAKSTVCRKTMEQSYKEAADAFLLWNKAGGKVVRGLTLRRVAEADLYMKE